MENTQPIPYKKWPWWVKIISGPMMKDINPTHTIGITLIFFIGILVILSYQMIFNIAGFDLVKSLWTILLFVNVCVFNLWQSLASMWIHTYSDWDLNNMSLIRRILFGTIILLYILLPVLFK